MYNEMPGEAAPLRCSDRLKSKGRHRYDDAEQTVFEESSSSSEEQSSDSYATDLESFVEYDEAYLRDRLRHGKRGRLRDAEYRPGSAIRNSKSTRGETHGCKKRRTVVDDEDEDDEEVKPLDEDDEEVKPVVENNEQVKTGDEDDRKVNPIEPDAITPKYIPEAPAAMNLNETPARQATHGPRVKLEVTTPRKGSSTIFVSSTTIGKIAKLAPQLTPSGPSQRQTVKCSTRSGDETFAQAIEFLESGILEPLTKDRGSKILLGQLRKRIKLFDVSQELGIADLATAVLTEIDRNPLLDPGIFAQFAAACYDGSVGHRLEKDSPLGRLVKAGLGRFIPEMIVSGAANEIRRGGGPLADELMDVVWARHEKMEKQRVNRLMADQELIE